MEDIAPPGGAGGGGGGQRGGFQRGRGKAFRARGGPRRGGERRQQGGGGGHRPSLKEGSMLAGRVGRGALRGRVFGRVRDRDGDAAMDGGGPAPYRSLMTRPGGGGGGNSRLIAIKAVPPIDQSQVSVQQLMDFLVSKCPTPVAFAEGRYEGQRALLTVAEVSHAIPVAKLNGTRINGHRLLIHRETKYVPPGSAGPAVAGFKGSLAVAVAPVIDQRYNKAARLLDLGGLGGTTVAEVSWDFNRPNFVRSVFSAASHRCPDLETVSFANNAINTLQAFSQMARLLPTVINVNFESNQLASFAELDHIKDVKMREIMISKNPMSVAGGTSYHSEVLRRFPDIKYVDGVKVEPLISFGISDVPATLPPLRGSFFDSLQTQQVCEAFLKKYFQVFDSTQRNLLVDAYTDSSYFSMTSSCTSPPKGSGTSDVHKRVLTYKALSRNLLTIEETDRRMKRLLVGRTDIVHFIKNLPQTQHQPDDYRIDAYLLKHTGSEIIALNIHGHILEAGDTRRSFDRAFLLVAPTQQSAIQQGWPAQILNDEFHLRNFDGLLPSAEPVAPPAAAAAAAAAAAVPAAAPALSQAELVQRLAAATGLKPEFAQQALQEHAWDGPAALATVQLLLSQGRIAPEMRSVP